MEAYKNYKFGDDNAAEQHNTLVLLDNIFEDNGLKHIPEFILCGGTALLFQGVIAVATIDIDTANRLSNEVSAMVEPLISDAAADVILLPKKYMSRIVHYEEQAFKHMKVSCLSLEDIVITKLYAWRHKDIEDLIKTSLLDKVNKTLIKTIINEEVEEKFRQLLLDRFTDACDRQSLQN